MYREMRFARAFDRRAISLQRRGELGTYPPMAGQEGAQVGSAHALESNDWVLYQYREHAVAFARGVDPVDVLSYWRGRSEGNARLADANILPINIPIATQIPHAVGMAWASRLKDEAPRAFVCHFGDGATSEGDFHEGLNFAGVFDTPNVFFCNNNQWAISVPRERQTASATIAQKATAYGFEGVQVDGMDPLAVYQVSAEALENAKSPEPEGRRPTLIEAVLYRYGAHTTADDPTVYRDDDEVERWKRRDPIQRMERYLIETGRVDTEEVDAIEAAIEDRLDDVIAEAKSRSPPDAEDIFDHVYAEVPTHLQEQRERLLRLQDRHGDDALPNE